MPIGNGDADDSYMATLRLHVRYLTSLAFMDPPPPAPGLLATIAPSSSVSTLLKATGTSINPVAFLVPAPRKVRHATSDETQLFE